MDTTTINQLIETGGFIVISLIGSILFLILTNRKNNTQKEVMLLKDCLYFQLLVGRYKEHVKEEDGKSYLQTFHKEIQDEFNYKPSANSWPSNIKERLIDLKEYSNEVEQFISKTKIG